MLTRLNIHLPFHVNYYRSVSVETDHMSINLNQRRRKRKTKVLIRDYKYQNTK